MHWIAPIRHRLRALLHRARAEAELDEELRFHLEMEIEKYLAEGLPPAEARRRALVAFGGVERAKKACRDERGTRLVEDIARDLRYAARALRSSPLFTLAVMSTLGLGIGASVALFSVVDALLLRPLPYADPERLVEVWAADPRGGGSPYVAGEVVRAWREAGGPFERLFAHARRSVLYPGGAEPVTLAVQVVEPEFEETLGVRPFLGRGLDASDAAPGAEPVVVLDHGFWRTAFAGDPGVLGRTVEFDGIRHRIVGVMPRGFKFPTYGETAAWLPFREEAGDLVAFGTRLRATELAGRIAGAVDVEAAQARADGVAAGLAEARPRPGGWALRLLPFDGHRIRGDSERRAIAFLAGAVGCLLVVAVLNGVHLLLVRGWARTREIAVRASLGASRPRLVAQLLAEAALLAAASAIAAVALAWFALRAVGGLIPSELTFFAPYAIEVERRALLFALALAAAAGLVVGLVPALRVTRLGQAAAGAGLTPYAARTPARSRLRRGLVVAEVALSVTLLVGAGLLIHSFARLMRVDPGFRIDGLATLTLQLPASAYPTPEARHTFLRRLEERLESVPGVEGVAVGDIVAMTLHFTRGIEAEDGARASRPDGQPILLPIARAEPDYFDVFGVRIIAGRAFSPEDAGTDVAIVDRDLARHLWGDQSPLGRRFRIEPEMPWKTVVGVIDDLVLLGPDDRETDFEAIFPAAPRDTHAYASLGIRATGDPRALFPSIRAAVRELDPKLPIDRLETAATRYAEKVALPRFLLILVAILSGLALLLAAVGIHGVLAYDVAQRRHELGVRIALGARPERLARRVVAEGLALAATGAAVGVASALALAGLIRGLLFGVEPTDPATIAGVVVVTLAAAAIACAWPALHTLRTDPAEVLKAE